MAEQSRVAGCEPRGGARPLRTYKANMQAVLRYRPAECGVDITLFASTELVARFAGDPALGWQRLTTGRVTVHTIEGNHLTVLKAPHVAALGAGLSSHSG
jgi:thioesterase domain-containing protein